MAVATLPTLPGDMSNDAIAQMGLDEFLVRYGGVTREVATQFSAMYMPSTSQQDPVIDLDLYVSLMVTQPRPNVLKLLRSSYIDGIDYVMQDIEIPKNGRRHGGHLKKRVLLTPDCFKRLCMRSRTAAAETVRSYFLRMETLTRRYFGALAAKSQTNVGILIANQRPRRRVPDLGTTPDVPGVKQGDMYIFAVQGRVPNLYRVGSTTDFKRRMQQHGSSHADSIEARATRIRVCDVRRVEQCVNVWLHDKKYNGGKEVYQADYETIKSTIVACGLIAASHQSVADTGVLAPKVIGDENARPR